MQRKTVGSWRSRLSEPIGALHDNHPHLGPVIFTAAALFFFAQIYVAWVFQLPYNLIHNTISDLGNTGCFAAPYPDVCSPRHTIMNLAFVALGVVMTCGSALLYHEFSLRKPSERRWAAVGFWCMALAGLGAMVVGLCPENRNIDVHKAGAAFAIGVGNLGIFVLGASLTKLPEAMRRYMLVFTTISLTALLLFAFEKYFGIGEGTMERIAAYPEIVWLVTFGLYVWHYHPKRDDEPIDVARSSW